MLALSSQHHNWAIKLPDNEKCNREEMKWVQEKKMHENVLTDAFTHSYLINGNGNALDFWFGEMLFATQKKHHTKQLQKCEIPSTQ